MKSVFIAWTGYHRRSELLAENVGADMHFIPYGRHGNVAAAPARYAVLGRRTWQVLRTERPDVVFVQNPPLPCVVTVYLYSRRHGARYVIDSHSAAFLSPKWRWSLGLHRLLSRRALTTIVHNKDIAAAVKGWGCHTSVLGFTPGTYPPGEAFPLDGGFNVAVISTGAEDEPLDVVFEGANLLPDVAFYVTGNASGLSAQTLAKRPRNCHMAGYLPYGQYVGLLRGANAVLDLTTRDHTVLMGAFEAVSLGTPLIVSDWPVLRDYFHRGTVHVPNTAEGVRDGVRRAEHDQASLRREIVGLREELDASWTRGLGELRTLLGES